MSKDDNAEISNCFEEYALYGKEFEERMKPLIQAHVKAHNACHDYLIEHKDEKEAPKHLKAALDEADAAVQSAREDERRKYFDKFASHAERRRYEHGKLKGGYMFK